MNKGFTLFEVLVYITLLSMLLAGLIVSSYHIIDNTRLIRTRAIHFFEVLFVIDTIRYKVIDNVLVSPLSGESVDAIVIETEFGIEKIFARDGQFFIVRNSIETPLVATSSYGADLSCGRFSGDMYDVLDCEMTYGLLNFSKRIWLTQ